GGGGGGVPPPRQGRPPRHLPRGGMTGRAASQESFSRLYWRSSSRHRGFCTSGASMGSTSAYARLGPRSSPALCNQRTVTSSSPSQEDTTARSSADVEFASYRDVSVASARSTSMRRPASSAAPARSRTASELFGSSSATLS